MHYRRVNEAETTEIWTEPGDFTCRIDNRCTTFTSVNVERQGMQEMIKYDLKLSKIQNGKEKIRVTRF